MKMVKIIGIIILMIIVVFVSLLAASTINHKIQLRKESQKYSPKGIIVEFDGINSHVFTAGTGDLTLVFLSGHGTTYPTLDFKPIWVKLVDDYRIAVVEKPGYGWSEPSKSPRDIASLLEETRKALEMAGEAPPYVLIPHSMSGLEAIFWAQNYPDEVHAIIGLDPCTPEIYDVLPEPEKFQLYTMFFISRIGITRLMPDSEIENNFPLLKTDNLTEKEKQEYLAVFYKNAFSIDMLREIDYLQENARTIAEREVPVHTPLYFFISSGQDAVVDGWSEILAGYISKVANGKQMQLTASHYIHYEKAEIVAEEITAFLDEIK